MLNDSSPWSLRVCIVYCRISLEVWFIKHLCLKTDRTIFQRTKFKIKVCINGTSINNLRCHRIKRSLIRQIIHAKSDLNAV